MAQEQRTTPSKVVIVPKPPIGETHTKNAEPDLVPINENNEEETEEATTLKKISPEDFGIEVKAYLKKDLPK